jgi:hypothetical protein
MAAGQRVKAMDQYQITFEQRPSYLYVTVKGPNTAETIGRYLADIHAACLRFEQTKVLLVVSLDGPGMSMLDVYKAVAAGFDDAAGTGIRAAYVDLLDHSLANMLLVENVAMTRGLPVRTFKDIAAAEAWLLTEVGH